MGPTPTLPCPPVAAVNGIHLACPDGSVLVVRHGPGARWGRARASRQRPSAVAGSARRAGSLTRTLVLHSARSFPSRASWTHPTHKPSCPLTAPENKLLCLHDDHRGAFWPTAAVSAPPPPPNPKTNQKQRLLWRLGRSGVVPRVRHRLVRGGHTLRVIPGHRRRHRSGGTGGGGHRPEALRPPMDLKRGSLTQRAPIDRLVAAPPPLQPSTRCCFPAPPATGWPPPWAGSATGSRGPSARPAAASADSASRWRTTRARATTQAREEGWLATSCGDTGPWHNPRRWVLSVD